MAGWLSGKNGKAITLSREPIEKDPGRRPLISVSVIVALQLGPARPSQPVRAFYGVTATLTMDALIEVNSRSSMHSFIISFATPQIALRPVPHSFWNRVAGHPQTPDWL
jgi:hypothetical protein